MCGINGVLAIDPISNLKGIISRMNEVIIHRGPDDSGTFIDSNQMIALGMRRLAIIDLESGHQPMLSDDGSIIVVFNGEIYNYKKLRAELSENHGVTFSTGSDTEVILKGYQLLGTAYFSNLNGMFAFAIYDVKLSRVFLVRDRTGEKPLYFWTNSRYFVFASEIKSLKAFMSLNHLKQPAISKTAMNLFFSLTYIPAPYSIFEGISKLEPGHFLEVNTTDLSVLKKSYWSFSTFLDQDRISDYSLAKRELQRLLYESVESRMISDVPYGAFLSGGVDSSIVTAVMSDISRDQKIKTFSIISQNSKFDESARSNAVSKHCNTEHYPISLDLKSIEEDIEKVILNFDEPFADSSALPTYYVSKVTSNYVKVALTGDGGDEVFGGYNRYLMPYYSKLYKNLIPSWLHDFILKPAFSSISLKTDSRGSVYRLKKFIDAIGRSEYDNLINIMSLGFLQADLGKLLQSSHITNIDLGYFREVYSLLPDLPPVAKSRLLDFKICLEGDMLVKVDRTSMLSSIECRSPFLDHNLIEFSFSIPDKFLISGRSQKRILKDTFAHLLPERLFSLPKSGFGVPVGDWLRESLRGDLLRFSERGFLLQQGIFNYEYVASLVNNHLGNVSDNTFKVWSFYCFQKWWVKEYQYNEA